jgi:hypothetical protein
MKLIGKRTLQDGSTLALLEFSQKQAQKLGLCLVKLRPGLEPNSVRSIDQQGGGVELLREWIAPWNRNPGSTWQKALSEGLDTFLEVEKK